MATVSMEEFGALQSQLMQMKAGKIALEDMNRRYMKEMEDSSKEVAKLQRIITKSKKAKEFQALIDAHAEEMQQLNAQKAGLTETLTNLSAENEALRIGKPAGPSQSDGHPLSLPPQVNRMEDDLTKSKKRCAELELKLTTMMKNYDEIKTKVKTFEVATTSSVGEASVNGSSTNCVANVSDAAIENEITSDGDVQIKQGVTVQATDTLLLVAQKKRAEQAESDLAKQMQLCSLLQADKEEYSRKHAEVAASLAVVTAKLASATDSAPSDKEVEADVQRLKNALDAERRRHEVDAADLNKVFEIAVTRAEAAEAEVQRLTTEFHKLEEIADRRKSTLNSMATERETVLEAHRQEICVLKNEHESLIATIKNKALTDATTAADRIAEILAELSSVKAEAEAGYAVKEKLEHAMEREAELMMQNEATTTAAVSAAATADKRAEALEKALVDSRAEVASMVEAMARRDAEAVTAEKMQEDAVVGLKIVERKNMALIKELKRELKAEGKRADRLALELADAKLSHPSGSDLPDIVQLARGHSRSASTVSSSSVGQESTISHEGSEAAPPSPGRGIGCEIVEAEVTLIQRITQLQAEKGERNEQVVMLQDRVMQLEYDLEEKTKLIMSFAVRGGGAAKGAAAPLPSVLPPSPKVPRKGVGGLLDKVKAAANIDLPQSKRNLSKVEVSTVQETNARLQTVLEETLLKNMELHNLVEVLSQEKTKTSSSLKVTPKTRM